MKPLHRSVSGLLIAVVSVPLFMSLLACLPVPIGDPEKSRIDPELSGVWIDPNEPMMVLIEPYDKRTWLVTIAEYDLDAEICPAEQADDEDAEMDYDTLINRIAPSEGECLVFDERLGSYKAWRTQLGRHQFMTWEPKGGFSGEAGFATEFWFGFRIDKKNADEFSLWMIDADYDGFEEPGVAEKLEGIEDLDPPYDPRVLKSARRAVEKVIRRNVEDEDLYDDPMEFYRIRPEHYDLFDIPETD